MQDYKPLPLKTFDTADFYGRFRPHVRSQGSDGSSSHHAALAPKSRFRLLAKSDSTVHVLYINISPPFRLSTLNSSSNMAHYQTPIAVALAVCTFFSAALFALPRSSSNELKLPDGMRDAMSLDPFETTAPEDFINGEPVSEEHFWSKVFVQTEYFSCQSKSPSDAASQAGPVANSSYTTSD